MSESATPGVPYSPVERLETRSRRGAELFVTGGVVVGLGVEGSVIAGVALLACWLYLRVEITFVVGAVLVAGLAGDTAAPGTLLASTGLVGLLAVDLARTWASTRLVGLFVLSLSAGVVVFVVTLAFVAVHWVVAGVAVVLVGAGYGLARYERRVADPTDRDRSAETTGDGA